MPVQQRLFATMDRGDTSRPRRAWAWSRDAGRAVAGCAGSGSIPVHAASWHLREADGVHALAVPAGRSVVVAVAQGRLWLTVDGRAPDQVLTAGQSLRMAGPARLRLGALDLAGRGGAPGCLLHLRWQG